MNFHYCALIIVSFGPLASVLAMPQNRIGPNNPVGGFRPLTNNDNRRGEGRRPTQASSKPLLMIITIIKLRKKPQFEVLRMYIRQINFNKGTIKTRFVVRNFPCVMCIGREFELEL